MVQVVCLGPIRTVSVWIWVRPEPTLTLKGATFPRPKGGKQISRPGESCYANSYCSKRPRDSPKQKQVEGLNTHIQIHIIIY